MSKLFIVKGRVDGCIVEFKVKVDEQDAYYLRSYAWGLMRNAAGGLFVRRKIGFGVDLGLGAQIMSPPEGHQVRHRNGDISDFRRCNLVVGAERVDKKRTVCFNGHELTAENVIAKSGPGMGVYCAICNKKAVEKYRAKKKSEGAPA